MKDYTNQRFWNHFSRLYDIFMKKDKTAYSEMYDLIGSKLTKGMKVLELATGTGLISLAVADKVHYIEATDFSPQMIAAAKKKKVPENVNFTVQDACKLSYEDESFDCVIISNALHIMPKPELALQNIQRVLKKDGVLIAPTFTHADNDKAGIIKAALMERLGFKAFHKWTQREYCDFLIQNGFVIERKQVLKADFPITYVEARKLQEERA
ncbi:methyltransferase family protein [Ruminiclostridium sufflavum DSM 19573]|uniref:Methyltransferase family protein n=1 Tax=Ruminiclostridium sufflavum DSM 19573 TaxID=1121337 RepID=A0A318XL39_9FIRM|nr:class I SAM-dependent methyltransferase [Ruminiclostridium sufflavum]PYG87964.1 methyltransferase family protein [Ruminiclostridium sufflavum DSM 19573]